MLVALLLLASPESVDQLIAEVPRVATDEAGVGPAEQALAKRLQARRAAAIPPLIALLKSDNAGVRKLAGFTLSDIDGLGEGQVDAMVAAWRAGNGWLPGAIARTGSRRAHDALARELVARPRTDDQLTPALDSAGDGGALALARELRRTQASGSELGDALCDAVDFHDHTAAAATAFLDVAAASELDFGTRVAALRALGCLRRAAVATVPALKALAQKSPGLAGEIDRAIVGIGSTEATAILIRQLQQKADVRTLISVAQLGPTGRAAGPEVVKLLSSSDWELRMIAARTLGYIGYGESTPRLIAALKDEDDWQLVVTAAESLGRLRAKDAVATLDGLAKSHWDDFTRAIAAKALAAIAGKTELPKARGPNFGFDFVDFDRPEVRTPMPKVVPGKDELPPAALAKLAFKSQVREPTRNGRVVAPTCGLKTADGHLLGTDWGEWGGELVFRGGDGTVVKLVDDNTSSIHRLGTMTVALVGLAHLTMNDGFLYRIDGKTAVRWKRLPGAPQQAGFLPDGRLFIRCFGGDVVVTLDGKLVSP